MHENIREGFDVFLHDGEKTFGAVRQVHKHELVVYVENAGDFEMPLQRAVKDAEAEQGHPGFRQDRSPSSRRRSAAPIPAKIRIFHNKTRGQGE